MSVISLDDAKSFLDVIHSYDDMKLQILLEAAEDESARIINVNSFDEWTQLPYSIYIAVLLLTQSNYEAPADEIMKYRSAAESKLMPYRVDMGV